jgi:hypothetical protein
LAVTIVPLCASCPYYVGQSVSFTVGFGNTGTLQALNVSLQVSRDLASGNLGTQSDPVDPPQVFGSGISAWYLVNSDAPQGSDWQRGPWGNAYSGFDSGPQLLRFKVGAAAAGTTLSTQVRVLWSGRVIDSAVADHWVLVSTPVALISPTPTLSPTPIVAEGRIAAYPQPARGRTCFDYQAPAGHGGALTLELYNLGFQKVAQVRDVAIGGALQTSCVDLSGLAPGLYVVRASLGDYRFPTFKLAVAR